jgi:hypothetical protein
LLRPAFNVPALQSCGGPANEGKTITPDESANINKVFSLDSFAYQTEKEFQWYYSDNGKKSGYEV